MIYPSKDKSFIIQIRNDQMATLWLPQFASINLADIYKMFDSKMESQKIPYKLNYTPNSISECYSLAVTYLKRKWLHDMIVMTETEGPIFNMNDYINRKVKYALLCSNDDHTKEELASYYTNRFIYMSNTFDMLKNILLDYYDNFISINTRLIEIKNICAKQESFRAFYKIIQDIDNKECFSFQQYVCHLPIHNNGIFLSNPIAYEDKVYTVPSDKVALDKIGIMWYNKLILTAIDIKKVLLSYLFAYYTESIFQIIQLDTSDTASPMDKVVMEVYRSTAFHRPIANFDVIEMI